MPSRDQIGLPKPEPQAPAPSSVKIDSAKAVPTAPCPLDRYDLQVTIKTIEFIGTGGKPLAPELAALLAPIAAAPPAGSNKVAVVCSIRDRATAALRTAGYVASVQIPPQRIEDGVLRLDVVAAHIVEVRVRGDAGPYRATLAARIEKLKALNPLNQHDAERILLLAGDVPGLKVQLALRPAGAEPGAVIGDLMIAYSRGAVLANVQNYGSRQIGRVTGYARAEVYGLTGAADLTYIGAQSTSDFDEQRVVQVGHLMGLGSNGVTLSLAGTYAWSKPDIPALDLRARSMVGTVEMQAPLVRSVSKNLTLAGGVDFIEQRTRVFGTGTPGGSPLNRDRIRTAFLRMTGSVRKPLMDGSDAFLIGGRVEVRQGLDILSATKRGEITGGFTPSRIEGKATATVVQGDIDASFNLGRYFTAAGSLRSQWSSAPVLNYDEFSIGNLSIGRGYDPGANSADRAVGLRGEMRGHIYDAPDARVDVFGFYDSVWIWNLDTNAIETDRKLKSFGGGMRVFLPGRAVLEAMYARPLDKALLLPGAVRAPTRVLISLTTRFAIGGM